jgi:hypothetical protein
MAKRYMETRLYSSISFVVHNKDTVKETETSYEFFFRGGKVGYRENRHANLTIVHTMMNGYLL